MNKFKISKSWFADIIDENGTTVDRIMFHTKWEAEDYIRSQKIKRR